MPPRCRGLDCNTQGVFNLPDEPRGGYCKKHKTDEMIDVFNPKCSSDDCSKQPCFNFQGERKGLYCRDHKLEGMVDIKERIICGHNGCTTRAVFNNENEKVPKYCVRHKESSMIDITKKTCQVPDCTTHPIFGLPGESAKFCKIHKDASMVDVFHTQRCVENACDIRPSFNIPGETISMYCTMHKKPGMVDILERRRCLVENCTRRPHFNQVGGKKGIYCAEHKISGMIDVISLKCKYCLKSPIFGYKGEKAQVCLDHKRDGMVDVRHVMCKTFMCDTRPIRDGYCARCYIYTFPESKVTRNFKTKELAVREFITGAFPNLTIIHDKRVDCFLYRPDFSIDMGSHIVIIENDENQHERYDTSCENKRLMSIFQSFNSRPLTVIRFNPDRYDNIKSCWGANGKLIGDGSAWRTRLEVLRVEIARAISAPPQKEVNVIHLFYDKV
jgi:hypothetical protein